jgi:putative membrane protein
MVADHKKDIAAYQKESKKTDAAGQYAKDTLPTLQKHLDAAQALEKNKSAGR